MPWKVPITVDGLTYPVEFGGDAEPSEADINAAVQQILSQSEQPPKEVPGYLSQLGTALSIGGRQMAAGVKGTFNAMTGDDADTAEAMARMGALQKEQETAQTPEDIALTQDFAKSKEEYSKASGVWDTAKALGGYVGDIASHPGAAFKQAVQSAPNAVIGTGTSVAGYALGGLLGAGAGVETGPGAILTGIAGAAAGGAVSNSLMEAGPAIYDVLNERTNGAAAGMSAEQISEVLKKDPTIVSEGLKTGAIRGSVIGLIEGLGMKGAGSILSIPERAAARAAQKTLLDAGVDVASKEAVEAAMRNTVLKKTVAEAAQTAKSQFTSVGNLGRGAAATTIETASSGIGEVAAQAASGQEIDPTAAVQEMMGEVGINAAMTPAVKAAALLKTKTEPAPADDFAQRAAMEGATEYRAPEVKVNGVTIATIPEGSDMTPEDVLDFANSPEDMAMLARNGKITLPEVVAPIEGVDPAITDEMNERLAASAALAPQTVEALKAAPEVDIPADISEAQIAPTVGETAAPEVDISEESLQREWQKLEDRALAAIEFGATDRVPAIRDEQASISKRLLDARTKGVKAAETLGVTPPPAPTLEASEGAARNAEMLRQAAARAAGTEQGPRIGFINPSVKLGLTPEESSATGAGMKEENKQTPRDTSKAERLKYLKSREVNTSGGTSLSDAEDEELAELTGQFPPTYRDPSKPEQMLPREVEKAAVEKKLSEGVGARLKGANKKSYVLGVEAGARREHRSAIADAFDDNKPVSTEAVDTYGIELPEGYARQGELYIFQPSSEKSDLGAGAATTPAKGPLKVTTPKAGKPTELELKAAAIGDDPAALKKRLNEAKSVLSNLAKKKMGAGKLDLENKRLIADDGSFALQWRVRRSPSEPISYENQQTSIGVVFATPVEKQVSPVTTTNETPSNAANAAGGSQSVQTEPAEGSIPTVTEDTVSISDIPSTTVTPQGEAPTTATEGQPMPGGSGEWSPTPGQPATANINGQKIVGTVGPSTGKGLVSFQYEWNGKTQKATVRPDRLSRPVASLTEPPSYQYTQEQNTRKAGKHFPTAPGVHANHDFRKSFASMAEDTSLSRIYRQIAKVMSKMDAFANIDLHIVADGDIGYAGEYSHSNGKSSIAVNLRQVARGKVDALGTILHEALHHITLAKVRNPQGAFETEVVDTLDTIRKRVREYAKQQRLGKRLGYELNTLEEFISALTSPDFQNFLASIPDSFSTGVSVGKFRSVLSEVFRLIAELIKGEPVARGSAMEQYFTTVLALFETPHRTLDIGKLEKLSAVQSGVAQATPESLRHAELETKFNAGTITPEETAEAQALVDERAKAAGYETEAWHGSGSGPFSTFRLSEVGGVFVALDKKEAENFATGKNASLRRFYVRGKYPERVHLSVDERVAANQAKRAGRDGIRVSDSDGWDRFANKPVERSVNLLVFDRNNIKSADPFTGVPLDQRFDKESNDIRASLAEGSERRGYRTPADMLAEAAQKAKGEAVGTKPQGLASMFKPQAKRPATGERKLLDMPVRNTLANAYREAVRGSGTQFAPLSSVYAQARLLQPGLTPEAFLAQVQEGYDNGTLLLEGAGSQQEAEQAGLALPGTPVGTAVRMMPAPETPKSLAYEETDAAYMAAVEAGDMETAQRMVDEAAKAAGYDREAFKAMPEKDWRTDEPINVIKSTNGPWAGFFTDAKEVADRFGRIMRQPVRRAFLKLSKPFEVDASGKAAGELQFDILDDSGPYAQKNNAEILAAINSGKYDGIVLRNTTDEGTVIVPIDPSQIKSADPVTRDEAGNVIPLSQRFNPESPSILYAAPIDTSTLPTRDPASGENVPDREAGSSENAETVSQRLESRRKEAISAAVAENDWGNYTREQKVAAAESFLAKWVVSFSAMEFPADVRFSVEVGDGSGAHVSVHEVPSRPLGIRVSVGQNRGLDKYANLSPTEVFAHLYDTAQEESIHVAQYLGMHRDWLETREQGFKGTFLSYIGQKLKDTFDQINKARIDLQQTDSAAAEKIKDAMLASWNIYHFNDRVEGIAGLWSRLEGDPSRQGDFIMEMVRQLTQLKRQDFTTETGWQKFQRVLKQWITDAINSLRGVQDVFRSGMAGDLIQRQLADLEAALDGKPLPPVSRGTAASLAEGSEPPTIDIGGEAEPADGKGKQLFQKEPTAIGSTYLTPADITLQEKKTQQETLDAARKIIGEEIAKTPGNTLAGRRAALDRFSLDTSIPPEVRAVGTGVIAQQADRMANLSEGDSQLLLDRMAEEAASLSDAMSSDLEGWRNLKADANLRIDKMAEEAGRTLNIFNVFRRLTPEGFLRRRMRQYNDAVREKMGQNFDVPVGEVEAEIMRLWKMMQEAGATARGEAIAAALKAFMPRRANTRKILESLFPQAGARDRMSKGGEALVRSFFQMMAGARDQKGPLAEFDETIQGALSSMLRKVMEAKGLVAKNESVQMKDIDKLVRAISADELRFDKIAAADEAMQKELDAIEDPERRAVLQQAWEEATAKMYTNIASDATVRRALNAELKAANVDWRKMFDSNQKSDAIKAKTVDAVMAKIEALLTDSADPTVRANLGMLRSEVEAAFDFIAANKRTEWLAQREAIEARRRVAEHRAAFMEALRNQGVAEQAINRISEKLAGPQRGKPDQNPVSALVGEHMKAPVADFVDKMVALDVDRATAESLGKAASTLRSEVAAAEKLKAAERAVAQLMKSLKPKPRAPREKIEGALKTLFTADTVGALDDQAFFDAFGEAFNMPPLSDEQQTRIKKLIREVNALPKGPARLDKQQDLDEELALWKGIAARDVLLSAWYANILSGVSTQGMGLLGNALNFVPRSLFNMINNPRSAGAYFKGAFGEGLSTGLKEAKAAMAGRGLYKVSKYGDKNLVSALELLRKKGPSTLPEWVAYIASAGTRLRYVFRIMQAIDALAWNTAREGHAYLAAHRALLEQEKMSDTKRSPEEFSRAFIDSLGGDVAQIEEDLRAARQALIDAGQTPSLLTMDRMAREARNLRRAASGVKAGNRFADRIVLQQDPEGSGKFISNLIDVFQKKDILGLPIGQLLIPFNRIVSNLFEQSLDYTPVGLVRAFLGGHLSDVKPGSFWNGKVEFKDKSQLFDQMERRERAMAAVTGMAAAAIIYALASAHEDEPDEDTPFMVYGWGPESKNKRAQMPKGWVPYSIKIGDNYIKFSEMPFGMMLAAAGSAMDAMRYKNMDKKTSTQRLAYVLKTAAKGFLNQGVMSSLDTAMETLMFDASEKKMADIPVNALKGLVPAQGMLRDISTIMDPNKVSSESLTSALLRDIPFAKSWGTKPDLNVFGEPIKLDGYPITRRIITHREPHAVADYLGRNELHIPGMEQTIEIGKYLPDKAKDRIQARAVELGAMENGLFTPEQNYTFKKRAGELTKVAVQEIMEKNPKIATDKQRESIQSTINKRVEAARRRAMLEAVPVK